MEPVGITNASASNVRNRNASPNATTIDSTVRRGRPGGLAFCRVASAADWGPGFFGVDFMFASRCSSRCDLDESSRPTALLTINLVFLVILVISLPCGAGSVGGEQSGRP